jgi:cytoskeletal protein CcmA (bactofilin family)
MKPGKRSRAITSILAILMLAILFAMALSLAGVANMNELQAANLARAEIARMQAESGVSFLVQKLSGVTLSSSTDPNLVASSIYTSLGTQLNGTPNLHGAPVTSSGLIVTVPYIATDANGRSFSATITVDANCSACLTVTGAADSNRAITKILRVYCYPSSGSAGGIFNYGMAAEGPISLTGNASLKGAAGNPGWGSLLTEANVAGNEVSMIGNCNIDGNVSVGVPDGNVAVTGNIDIGGSTGSNIWKHVDLGVGGVAFPTVNTSPFVAAVPSWTNVTSSTTTSGNLAFKNIWIKKNTNPTFSGNITIQGAVYVESPNVVTFAGNLNMTGVVITQNAGTGNTATNAIKFTGNNTFSGVENLPSTSDFQGLKQLPGSAILAPGFGVTFTGNFGSVNGTMAADAFNWTGNASGTIYGSIISYGAATMSLTGNSIITIDRSKYNTGTPPGFGSSSPKLVPNMDSYVE